MSELAKNVPIPLKNRRLGRSRAPGRRLGSSSWTSSRCLYSLTNVLAKGADGLYGLTNSAHTSFAIEFPGGDTNLLRVTETRDSSSRVYDCCGLSSRTERDGSTATYTYDALKRLQTTTYAGIMTSNVYDAQGNLIGVFRVGADDSVMTHFVALFDDAGRETARQDALGNVTLHTNYVDGSGQRFRQTTHADSATRTETYFRDGSLKQLDGSAVHPVRYEYGPTNSGTFSKETKLETNGTDLAEWTIVFSDPAGRPIQTLLADGAHSDNEYSADGLLHSGGLWGQPSGQPLKYQLTSWFSPRSLLCHGATVACRVSGGHLSCEQPHGGQLARSWGVTISGR